MSLNKVLLIGNVGREPEIRYVDSNMAVAPSIFGYFRESIYSEKRNAGAGTYRMA